MTSSSLQNFFDKYTVNAAQKTYTIGNFTITNDGMLFDGTSAAETVTGTGRSDILGAMAAPTSCVAATHAIC